MKTKWTRFRIMALISAAALGAAALVMGWLWPVGAGQLGWEALSLSAVVASTAGAGVTWQRLRAQARRRWQAAMDAYAEREIRRERQRRALKQVRTLSTALAISNSVGSPFRPRTRLVSARAAR